MSRAIHAGRIAVDDRSICQLGLHYSMQALWDLYGCGAEELNMSLYRSERLSVPFWTFLFPSPLGFIPRCLESALYPDYPSCFDFLEGENRPIRHTKRPPGCTWH